MTIQPRPTSDQSASDPIFPTASDSNQTFELASDPSALQEWHKSRQAVATSYPIANSTNSSRLSWFHNLPIRRKQLLVVVASEVLSVAGLLGVGSWLLISSGQAQLLNQAKSELAVTDVQYQSQIDHMGFGFRGQSENNAIIQAAKEYKDNKTISADLQSRLKQILSNEVAARNIEYATLVGTDLRIISSANANRVGQKFDPQGLVGTAITNPRQIKASTTVSWNELQAEAPPLPKDFKDQDALIRYVVTPVKDPQNGKVIGALVSGDIVNKKLPIVKNTLEAFENGYSAVYQRQPNGDFQLATSLDMGRATNLDRATANVSLPDTRLLEQAIAAQGAPVTRRLQMGDQTYTMAAEAILNFQNQPVAVLVRGTSEARLNALLQQSLLFQLGVAGLALLVGNVLAGLLGRSVAQPIERLRQVALRFAQGDRQARAKVFANDEVGELTAAFNTLAANVTSSESSLLSQSQEQRISAERARLLTEITVQIRRSLDPEEILSVSVEGVRSILKADRVLIYRFNRGYTSGKVTAESVGDNWIRGMGQTIYDPLTPAAIERYKIGRISMIENLDEMELTRCHCEILERLEVKANMVAPILVGNELIGLLCVHQCLQPRKWQPIEVDLLQQLATQIGYALAQAKLLQQQRLIAERERQVNVIVTKMRLQLEPQMIFNTVVKEVQAALALDRAIVFQFDPDWHGNIVAEAVEPGWPPALKAWIKDPCFAERYVEQYRKGRVQATENIYEANLTECHLKQLEPFQVKANSTLR